MEVLYSTSNDILSYSWPSMISRALHLGLVIYEQE